MLVENVGFPKAFHIFVLNILVFLMFCHTFVLNIRVLSMFFKHFNGVKQLFQLYMVCYLSKSCIALQNLPRLNNIFRPAKSARTKRNDNAFCYLG